VPCCFAAAGIKIDEHVLAHRAAGQQRFGTAIAADEMNAQGHRRRRRGGRHADAVELQFAAGERSVLTRGLGASPGAAVGRVALSADDAAAAAERGEQVILVRSETSPEDVHGMLAAEGILTARGGLVSHAAVVARGWGKPAVVGADALRFADGQVVVGDVEYGVAPLLWTRLDDLVKGGGVIRGLDHLIAAADLDPILARRWILFRCVEYWLWGLGLGLTEDPARCQYIVEMIC